MKHERRISLRLIIHYLNFSIIFTDWNMPDTVLRFVELMKISIQLRNIIFRLAHRISATSLQTFFNSNSMRLYVKQLDILARYMNVISIDQKKPEN